MNNYHSHSHHEEVSTVDSSSRSNPGRSCCSSGSVQRRKRRNLVTQHQKLFSIGTCITTFLICIPINEGLSMIISTPIKNKINYCQSWNADNVIYYGLYGNSRRCKSRFYTSGRGSASNPEYSSIFAPTSQRNKNTYPYSNSNNNFALYSSLFFDDDDLNWDDEDDDINIDVQYQGRALVVEDDKGRSGQQQQYDNYGVRNDKKVSSSIATLKKEKEDDDTDDSYYDNLFQQQEGIVLNKEDEDDDDDDDDFDFDNFDFHDDDESNDVITNDKNIMVKSKLSPLKATEPTTSLSNDTCNIHHLTTLEIESKLEEDQTQKKESILKAEEYHEKMEEMKQRFQTKQKETQHLSKVKRKQERYTKRQMQLHERATFLALRALRRQSNFHHTMIETTINNSSSSSDDLNNIQTQESPQLASFHTKNSRGSADSSKISATKTAAVAAIITKTKIPSPTLSFSASRNYKRKEDSVNDHLLEIEQKLYGRRFKNAYNIYHRLLQTLENMKFESKQKANEHVLDKVERSVQTDIAAAGTTTTTTTATLASKELLRYDVEKCIDMNQYQQKRMNTIVKLSLYRNQDYTTRINSFLSPSSIVTTRTEESIINSIHDEYDFDSIDIQDLISILRIRGNVKRRGRLPKTRKKVIEQLSLSFSTDLFQ